MVFVRRESTTSYNAVDMGMVHEVLSPGMQDAYEADTCAKTVISKLYERFGYRAKEKGVHNLPVSQNQGIEF